MYIDFVPVKRLINLFVGFNKKAKLSLSEKVKKYFNKINNPIAVKP